MNHKPSFYRVSRGWLVSVRGRLLFEYIDMLLYSFQLEAIAEIDSCGNPDTIFPPKYFNGYVQEIGFAIRAR